MSGRTAILLRCSTSEAATIHEQSKIQRRTVAGYSLNILMKSVELDEMVLAQFGGDETSSLTVWRRPIPGPGAGTTMLLRCSQDEARRIRAAAKRRGTTISGYVLRSLRRAWKVQMAVGKMPRLLVPGDETEGQIW